MAMSSKSYAQACPENIGFENGNFQNWKLYTGTTFVENGKNAVHTNRVVMPVSDRHTILNKNSTDLYGAFPVIPKNGGNYTVKLGNNGTGAQAEGISYLINVPLDRPEFTLTYQYAIVLEDPSHSPAEQPRFIARVKDIEKNQYIPCASFEYISTSTLPGFKKSKLNNTIIYKEWTPVTINLSGYAGKQLLIEFISADCTLGGHFGYAYIDVNNLCGNLIIGNTYCKNSEELNVSGPSGFQDYKWYNEDKTIHYGSGQSIVIKPTPPEGSKVILDLVPYTGFGCSSSITSTVHSVDYQLQTIQKSTVCENAELDLTSTDYILNKSADFTYLVYEDKDLTQLVKGLVKIKTNKTYYVLATNYKGCESVAAIDISVYDIANITAKKITQVCCYNESVDITQANLYTGDLTGITMTYHIDPDANQALTDPKNVKISGIYYIKLTNDSGCSKVIPVDVVVNAKPLLKITNPDGVCFPSKVDITAAKNFMGSDDDLTYSFYVDQALTLPIPDPKNIDKTGSYYIKVTNSKGCTVNDKIDVIIYKLPVLVIKDPDPVCYPEKVDITNPELYVGTTAQVSFSYFYDDGLTNRIIYPKQISQSGIYFVKITNANGCFISGKVNIIINPLPIIVLNKPKAIFDHDFIDLTSASIIKGSKGYTKVSYFEDAALKKPVSDPTKVNKPGIYYIVLENDRGCSISSSIELSILPAPKIIVPTAFTPQKSTNNRLYPFFVSIQKLISFKIYNKWGILVYETDTQANGGWDGQFKSKMQPLETFSWFAEGLDLFGGRYQSRGKTILIL